MISEEDVKKLAKLSRLSLTEPEVAQFKGEMEAIVSYIDTIQKVILPKIPRGSAYLEIENVTRADGTPHEAGIHTEALLSQAPEREGNYLKVKKIIEQ